MEFINIIVGDDWFNLLRCINCNGGDDIGVGVIELSVVLHVNGHE